MYTVPKLDDYSPAALDRAIATSSPRSNRTSAVKVNPHRNLPRSLDGAQERRADADQRHMAEGRPRDAKRDVGTTRQRTESPPSKDRSEDAQTSFTPLRTEAKLDSERIDITLPGIRLPLGVQHPMLRSMHEIVTIFQAMGYSVGEGPEVETDYYNFESLNFPPNHPARDTQDTLFIAGQERKPQRDRLLLRTHTSPVQIRTMEKQPPPVRIVIPGKVHRNDAADATHSPVFHQVEGLAVDTNITFCDLKGTLDHAMKALFGSQREDALLSIVLPLHRAQRRRAGQLHLLRRQGLPQVQAIAAGSSCWAAAWSIPNVFGFVKAEWLRREKDQRLRLRHGRGPHRDAEVRHRRHPACSTGDVRFLEQFA